MTIVKMNASARESTMTLSDDALGRARVTDEDVLIAYYAKVGRHLHAHCVGKIIGVGLNYTEHVAESARTLDIDNPLQFLQPGVVEATVKSIGTLRNPVVDVRRTSCLCSAPDVPDGDRGVPDAVKQGG